MKIITDANDYCNSIILKAREPRHLSPEDKIKLLEEMGIDVDRFQAVMKKPDNMFSRFWISLRQYIEEME